MKFLSWNINGRRVEKHLARLKELNPDVIALQEVTPGRADRYCEALEESGWTFTLHNATVKPEGFSRYGELVASRFPIVRLSDLSHEVWTRRLLSVTVAHPKCTFELHNAHVPDGSTNKWVKIEFLEALYQRLANDSKSPRILCGDFNTPQEEISKEQIVTWAERKGKGGDFYLRKNRGKRWDDGERNVLTGLAQFDLPDIYRLLNGYDTNDHSWVWRDTVGRRFDHVFASKLLGATSCRYLHAWREEGLSDHSPIVVDFDI